MSRTFVGVALSLAFIAGASGDGSAKVTGEKAERAAADKVVVSWTDKAPVDIYMSERPDAALGDAKLVSKGNATGHFEATAAAHPYFLLKDTGDATTVRVGERVVPLAQGSNFRDLGGYPAADGKHVRWGLLYRSGGTPLLSDADVAKVQALGIKDLIDLRSSEERVLAPTKLDGIRYTAIGYRMPSLSGKGGIPTSMSQVGDTYRNFPTMLAPQVKALFRTLLAAEGPLAYNCSAGQDRTGFATALVLTVLGVPRDEILADYHLSTVYRHPEYELPKIDATGQPEDSAAFFFATLQKDGRMSKPQPLYDANHRALLEYAFDEMQSRWGGVEGYLNKEIGVSAADIAKLRKTYLE